MSGSAQGAEEFIRSFQGNRIITLFNVNEESRPCVFNRPVLLERKFRRCKLQKALGI